MFFSTVLSPVLFIVAFIQFTNAIPAAAHDFHDHSDNIEKRLPNTWHLPSDHPVHALFKRAPGDYPQVGSPSKFKYSTFYSTALITIDSMVERVPDLYS